MGFTDVIAAFPKLWRQFHQVRDAILQSKPDAVILIDYPGFNLRLAKALRKKGFQGKIIQMISPTVWAWGKGRIDQMASTLDMLLTIYPFEEAYFSHTPLPVHYIGHPLVESIANYRYDETWKDAIGIPSGRPIIGIFPGSREGEITRNLPLQLEAAALLKKAHPEALFALSCIDDKQELLLKEQYKKSSLAYYEDVFFIPRAYTYDLMRDCRTAIAKSGTVTLELALHHIPTVVVYQLSTLNRLIAQHILRLRLPYYCIVNILCNKTVFPEWIAKAPTAESLFHDLTSLFLEGEDRSACLKGCLEARQRLGTYRTSQLAAQYITTLRSS
jgi:lipid-A-disaccharide synthase